MSRVHLSFYVSSRARKQ